MSDYDSRVERLLDLIGSGEGKKVALAPFVAINGSIQSIHFHISAAEGAGLASVGDGSLVKPVDVERSRRLAGIHARLKSVPSGQKKVSAYLRREFGKAEPEDVFGPDLERLYAWVHSLPHTGA